jgi:hypothetical protein
MLDHATGLVVGETTVIGKNCSFLHGVTLGATGKEHGDRHPKIGNDVLIGCNVTVLGNITIEDSVSIGSGSIVLKPLPAHSTAVGNPARIIGASRLISPAKEMDTALNFTDSTAGVPFKQTWSTFADGSCVFTEADTTKRGKIDRQELAVALTMRFGIPTPDDLLDQLFQEGDADKDGYIDKEQFELISSGVKAFKKLAKNRTYEAGDGV